MHIPTCAWLDSGVPAEPTALHAVTSTTVANGYTVFLVYNITVTPSAVTWNWGDGSQTASLDASETAPATLPNYDAFVADVDRSMPRLARIHHRE